MKIKNSFKHIKTQMHENEVQRDTSGFNGRSNILQDIVQ